MFEFMSTVSLALSLLVTPAGHGRPALTGGPAIDGDAAGGRCPLIYAPVICDNGKTYPNQCEADRHHAKNCVPTGQL